LPWLTRLLPTGKDVGSAPCAAYLQVSPHHLINTGKVRAILRREQARFMVMAHDLIPIGFSNCLEDDGPRRSRMRSTGVTAWEFAPLTRLILKIDERPPVSQGGK